MRLPKALFLLLRINDAACYISFLKSFEQKLGLKDRNPQIVPAFPWWRWGVGGGTGEWKEGRKKTELWSTPGHIHLSSSPSLCLGHRRVLLKLSDQAGRRQWWVCWRPGARAQLSQDHRDRSLRESAENHPIHETQLYFPLVSLYFQQSVFSPGKCPGQRSLVGYRPWGPQSCRWLKQISSHAQGFLNGIPTPKCTRKVGHTPCSPTYL